MRIRSLLLGLISVAGLTSHAQSADTIENAFREGEAHLNFRYRYENVDQDGFSDDARASTLRTRLNYRTEVWRGLRFFVELDDLTYVGDDDFNNTRNGKVSRPVVADPDGTDVNQLYVDYNLEDTVLRLGRQRINLDNQRFVGGVGWRQNEQTYDAFTVSNNSIANTTVVYSYIDNVSRIFGPENGVPAKDLDSQNHVFNLNYKSSGGANISAYAYFMDLKDADTLSNRTVGVRYSNTFELMDLKFPVNVEFAGQEDYGDNPFSYSANYYLLEAGIALEGIKVMVANEVLEGNDRVAGEAFVTPAATLHAFQGWADQFLATPPAGIDDRYVSVSGGLFGGNVGLTWHKFEAESGSADYGNEWDLAFSRKLTDHFSLLLKVARYQEDGFSVDTTKAWLMLSADF
ncbi:MAG: alginate export family protein [Pseudomonadales bacterium]